MPKNDEGSIRWGCKYLVPNARIKQHRAVKLDVLKTSKDESERWHIISILELCELSSLRNYRRAIILAGEQGRDKLGDKLGDKKDKTGGRWTHPPTKANKKEDKLAHKLGDKRDKDSGRRTNHPTKGKKRRETVGDKGEGGHTTQQRETRRETSWEIS